MDLTFLYGKGFRIRVDTRFLVAVVTFLTAFF